ncbi:hypothetical protein [Egicoccus halophilus]|nr:hypothetical protein [Egicoccus halophilus]
MVDQDLQAQTDTRHAELRRSVDATRARRRRRGRARPDGRLRATGRRTDRQTRR